MHPIDELLCNASESELRNVLAIVSRSITHEELVAAFECEAKMVTREHAEAIAEEDVTFAMQIGMKL